MAEGPGGFWFAVFRALDGAVKDGRFGTYSVKRIVLLTTAWTLDAALMALTVGAVLYGRNLIAEIACVVGALSTLATYAYVKTHPSRGGPDAGPSTPPSP